MDTIPSSQRIRWSSLESINNLTWSGSAVLGGILIDRYGIGVNFLMTIVMQVICVFFLIRPHVRYHSSVQ
jgi:predicted MFS family arabinose efflux permease